MDINANGMHFRCLNDMIRTAKGDVELSGVQGQRFIAAGQSGRTITINGTPGNALGAYLNGASIVVNANAQDAVGDTMNDGRIVIHGNIGDAAGYAMRGGKIFVKGNAGYRAGIHMKAYKDKIPEIIIGGTCGSFLGEYQAGGVIIVLGLALDGESAKSVPSFLETPGTEGSPRLVGSFPCTGMHGGKMFLRGDQTGLSFPAQVNVRLASEEDMEDIKESISEYCSFFGCDIMDVLNKPFTLITPNSNNPYKQMYVAN